MARIHGDSTTRVAASQTDQVLHTGPCKIHGIVVSGGSGAGSLTIKDGTTTVMILTPGSYTTAVILLPTHLHISIATSLKITTNATTEGLLFVEY